MSEANITLSVEVEICVEVWAEDVTDVELATHIERDLGGNVRRAIEKHLGHEKEVEAGWVDPDHEAVVVESHDACVLKVKVVDPAPVPIAHGDEDLRLERERDA